MWVSGLCSTGKKDPAGAGAKTRSLVLSPVLLLPGLAVAALARPLGIALLTASSRLLGLLSGLLALVAPLTAAPLVLVALVLLGVAHVRSLLGPPSCEKLTSRLPRLFPTLLLQMTCGS